jgi:excisionase family DNA binding protein
MEGNFSIIIKGEDFETFIDNAIGKAIKKYVKKSDEESKLFTVEEAAKYLGISTVTLWLKRKEGKIISTTAGRLNLYTKSALDAYLNLYNEEVSNG